MYQVKFTAAFKKKYKSMKKRNLDLTSLDNVIDKLRQGIPLEKKHKEHGLNVTSNRIGYSYISSKTIF